MHHIYNRGIARRTVFETREDKRFFESRLARAVRHGEIRIHAFSILTTHYHLLATSVDGQLSQSMQQIQTSYSRYFNRSRRRDGPLVRGRFGSRLVDTAQYFEAVVRYIDLNAQDAGLCDRPEDYAYSSAGILARRHARWLEADEQRQERQVDILDPSEYSKLRNVIECRLDANTEDSEPLEAVTPESVMDWMRRKAMLADGTRPGLPTSDVQTIIAALELHKTEFDILSASFPSSRIDPKTSMLSGLLLQVAGLRLSGIGKVSNRSPAAVGRAVALHAQRILSSEPYAELAGTIALMAVGNGPLGRLGKRKFEPGSGTWREID
ncbi:MAG: REP element-mobilizing transposase RayT [Planctomycetota bacterium]|jgi:REP element-mobilizing transposase RayT